MRKLLIGIDILLFAMLLCLVWELFSLYLKEDESYKPLVTISGIDLSKQGEYQEAIRQIPRSSEPDLAVIFFDGLQNAGQSFEASFQIIGNHGSILRQPCVLTLFDKYTYKGQDRYCHYIHIPDIRAATFVLKINKPMKETHPPVTLKVLPLYEFLPMEIQLIWACILALLFLGVVCNSLFIWRINKAKTA